MERAQFISKLPVLLLAGTQMAKGASQAKATAQEAVLVV
jgi:hypothetical protein